jgi:hypothetical protein
VAKSRYNANTAQEEFSFVDLAFVPDMPRRSGRVYPLAHRDPILKMIQSHFSQHPLITGSGNCNAHASEISALFLRMSLSIGLSRIAMSGKHPISIAYSSAAIWAQTPERRTNSHCHRRVRLSQTLPQRFSQSNERFHKEHLTETVHGQCLALYEHVLFLWQIQCNGYRPSN